MTVALGSVLVASAAAQETRSERVQFHSGATSAVAEDSITGYETVDYILGARAGQYMNVSMATGNGANYFNILAPGSTDEAMFNGSISGNQYEGVLPETGDYRIRVYLMRSAARHNEVADYRLEMIIGADGEQTARSAARGSAGDVPAAPEEGGPRTWEVTSVANALNLREQPSTSSSVLTRYSRGTILSNLGCLRAEGRVWCDVQELGGGPRGYVAAEYLKPAISPDGTVAEGSDDSALRAGQGDFDATGQIPCAQSVGQPMWQCDFGVARAGGGSATVVVTLSDGFKRAIFFTNGTPIGADTTEADGYHKFKAHKESDLHFISVGVFGG
jgi:hypothetical protein